MPELPEVETIVVQLRERGIEGRCVRSVEINWPRTAEPLSVEAFREALIGCRIESVSRVGKWMLWQLDNGKTIMIHLRMSGGFSMSPGPHDRITVAFEDGSSLYFHDPRKFGRWKLVEDPSDILKELGPDALTSAFSLSYFKKAMLNRHRMIKPLLLDQQIVAGLGNIYADEALWEAGIHPARLANSLTGSELSALHKAIRHVLRIGVKNRGTSLGGGRSNYRDVNGESGSHREKVKAYGRGGKPCKRCGTTMIRVVVAQRGTTYCPECQLSRS